MSDISTVKGREWPDEWLHAANTISPLRAVETRIARGTEEEEQPQAVLGIEVDVRVLPGGGVPVLRHDPFPVDATPAVESAVPLTEWLIALAGIVHAQERWVGVVKFDFKDPTAAELTHQLFMQFPGWFKTLRRCFLFWWNADVVAAVTPLGDTCNTGLSFFSLPGVELYRMIYTVVDEFGFGLSFGWDLPDGFRMYDVCDIHNMRVFLQRLATREEKWHSRPSCLTFAVRYSAVFGEESRSICSGSNNTKTQKNTSNTSTEEYTSLWQALDELLWEASSLFTVDSESPPCFLTFWRGRSETITDEEIAIAKARFPTCTIDVG